MTKFSAKIPQISICLALGVMAGVGISDAWGAMERQRCQRLTGTHSVISLRTFWGHADHCVDRRYL
jgi:hypothetical protein